MSRIKDVDTENNADLVATKLIAAAHDANDTLREWLNKLEISPDAFVDIIELGLDAAKARELLFRRLRNHYVMRCDECFYYKGNYDGDLNNAEYCTKNVAE
ncbi:hypothetical protein [uncultured Bacteroides sp.]|uniref:hypothetical protein n=1 Tax=uncultured Bacteroides sp. TaxID=162156 RepID=UPI002626F8E9|nr:hypothetical protein [uncultured Bacteroides sp.]